MKINEVIVVEGKSDTAKLKSLFDCDTIETGGSSLDRDCLARMKDLSKARGIIIFTDPDFPGMQIRQKITDYIPNAKHAFVQKKDSIAHGKVGIAEATPEAIKEALLHVVTFKNDQPTLLWDEFLQLDIIGNTKKRLYVYDYFHLGFGNAKTLYKRLNMAQISFDHVKQALEEGKF